MKGDQFGHSVVLSGDRAVIGVPRDDVGGGVDRGSAYVFELIGSGFWEAQQQLTAVDGAPGDNFGSSVALDGDTAVIGAFGDDGAFSDQGSAHVFVHDSVSWTETASLAAADAVANDWFGSSVAVRGTRVLVGAYGDDVAGVNQGSAWLFDLAGGPEIQIIASDTANSYAGWAVAVSGTNVVIGAPFAETLGRVSFEMPESSPPPSGPVSISLTPDNADRSVYMTHFVTAQVLDGGSPLFGQTVTFTIPGGVRSCQTGPDGRCSIGYGGPAFPRNDTIQGCAGASCDTATVQWIYPLSTLGSSRGAGKVMPPGPTTVEAVKFKLRASSASGEMKGSCLVKDDNAGMTFQCLDIAVYVQSGSHTFFYGAALANGASQTYRMDVNDGGAIDTLTLVSDGGYAVAGTVVKGSIRVKAP